METKAKATARRVGSNYQGDGKSPRRSNYQTPSATKKPRTAAELIATKVVGRPDNTLPLPCAEALVQLAEMLTHNDSGAQPHMSREDAIELLQGYGWAGNSKQALDTLCKKIGRASFAKAK